MAVTCALGFAACNNSSDNTGSNDSTATRTDSTTTSTTTVTSNNNYAARSDSFRVNSKAGYYLNPRTGKAYTNISMDTTSGAITDESGHPIRRYVDKRTWWVYDATSGDTVGTARMNNNRLTYRDMNNNWVDYNKRWNDDSTSMDNGSMNNGNNTMSTDTSNGNMGPNSKIKIKTPEGKVKATDKGVKVRPKGE